MPANDPKQPASPVGYESPRARLDRPEPTEAELAEYFANQPPDWRSGALVPPWARPQLLERIMPAEDPPWLLERLRVHLRKFPGMRLLAGLTYFHGVGGGLVNRFWPEEAPRPTYAGHSRRLGFECYAIEWEEPVSLKDARWHARKAGEMLGLLIYADGLHGCDGQRGVRWSILRPIPGRCDTYRTAPEDKILPRMYEVWQPIDEETRWTLLYSSRSLKEAIGWRNIFGGIRSIVREDGIHDENCLDGTPEGGKRFRRRWDVDFEPRLTPEPTAADIADRAQAAAARKGGGSNARR